MSQDTTVTAREIARLVDVGRAAVSNWRRRHEDFPQPVGGTAASPLFSLNEVQDWLLRNGKPFRMSLADRVWQLLRASGDDLSLGQRVGQAGALLLRLADGGDDAEDYARDDPELVALLTELAAERGHVDAFEMLCERYLDAHSRRLTVTPDDLARVMVRLVCPDDGSLLDPACGVGTLLLDAPAAQLRGQEINPTAARIAEVRLRLRGRRPLVVTADSLRADGFADLLADGVVCDPPFNERGWGYDELTSDPRWEYGLPPRGESELAWAQHCLAHVKPGGLVAMLMPAAAASRRPGKRIRGNLLRAGALRAVVTLADGRPDLWLLRRPLAGERQPSQIALLDAPDDVTRLPDLLRDYLHDPQARPPGSVPVVRIVDLLDDEVDVSPASQRAGRDGRDLGREYSAALDRFHARRLDLPQLDLPASPRDVPVTTVGELVKAGVLSIRYAPARMPIGTGDVPVLLADDLAESRAPSGWTCPDDNVVAVQTGDVVASTTGNARVIDTDGAVLGPSLARYRTDPDRVDPHFLAGVLRSAALRAPGGSSRSDARRTRVPRLPIAEQRTLGQAFRQLTELEDGLREASALGHTLVRLGFDGLIDGHLQPRG